MHPTHGGGHGDANELRFALVLGKYKRKTEEVTCTEEHAVEAVLDVVLAGLDRAEFQVGVSYVVEDSGQCVAKLHGLGRRVRFGGIV